MTFRKSGFIVALALAFVATPLCIQTAEAKVTKGQASVAKRSGKLYINQAPIRPRRWSSIRSRQKDAPTILRCSIIWGWLYGQKELFEEMNEHYNLATDRKWKRKVDSRPQRTLDAVLQHGRQGDECAEVRFCHGAIRSRHYD